MLFKYIYNVIIDFTNNSAVQDAFKFIQIRTVCISLH